MFRGLFLTSFIAIISFRQASGQSDAGADHLMRFDNQYNRVSFYSSWNNSLIVIEKNTYRYASLNGQSVSLPKLIQGVKGDVWYPQLSPTGKQILLFRPAAEKISDDLEIGKDQVSVFHIDSGKITGSFDLGLFGRVSLQRFADEQIVVFEDESLNGTKLRLWDLRTQRATGFFRDSAKGLHDIAVAGTSLSMIAKKADSLILMYIDTLTKKKAQTVIFGGEAPVARFADGHPAAIINRPETNSTEVFAYSDSVIHLVRSYPLMNLHAAMSDGMETWFVSSIADKKQYFLCHAVGDKRIQLPITADHTPIFRFEKERKFFTASDPYNGNIIAFDLAGNILWAVQPNDLQEVTTLAKNNELQSGLFSIQMKQGTTYAMRSFFDPLRNEILQVQKNKLVYLDAESGGEKRWIPFQLPYPYHQLQLSQDGRYLMVSYMRSPEEEKELYHFPFVCDVLDVHSGKTAFRFQGKYGLPAMNFLGGNRIIANDESEGINTVIDLAKQTVDTIRKLNVAGRLIQTAHWKGNDYLLFQSDNSVEVRKGDGKLLFACKRTNGENGYLSDGKPYLLIRRTMLNGNNSIAYKILSDTVQVIRKELPRHNALYGNDTALFVLYDKSSGVNRPSQARIMNAITGRSRFIDSLYFYNEGKTRLFPEQQLIVREENELSFHDMNTGYQFQKLKEENRTISSIAYSPDGRYLAAANPVGKVMLWDLATGKETRVLKVGSEGYITKLAFSGDGIYLAASSGDIWEVATGENLVSVTTPSIWDVNTIDYSKDGKTIISGGVCVITWDAKTGEQLRFQAYPDSSAFDRKNICFNQNGCIRDDYELMVHSSSIHPDNLHFVVGTENGLIGRFRVDTNITLQTRRLRTLQQFTYRINDLLYSRDGKALFALQQNYLYKLDPADLSTIDSVILSPVDQFVGIDISYDGETFATITATTGKQVVELRNISDLQVIKRFEIPGAEFNKISFSPNKKHLATASTNGFCTIWDIEKGDALMYLNTIGEYGNVMITPDNYYMASKSALEGVTIKNENTFYAFDQFDLYLNRPDIVLKRLGYADAKLIEVYESAYQKRLRKANKENDVVQLDLPEIKLVNRREIRPVSTQPVQKISLQVTDSSGLNGKVSVYANSNEVATIQLSADSIVTAIDTQVALADGINALEVVYTSKNGKESVPEKISVSYVPSKPSPAKVWYIGIGVSKYRDSTMNLRYATKDIQDLAKAFKKRYPNAVIDTLLDASVTRENILALKHKLSKTSINDKVIVSVSGHGVIDDSLDWYFGTADIDFKDPARRGLIYHEIENLLAGIPARQKLLLLDACHSGELDKEEKQTAVDRVTKVDTSVVVFETRSSRKPDGIGLQQSFELMQELFTNLSKGNGTSVVSAAGGREYAFESEDWKNGVFTYSILQVLNSEAADENRDADLTVREMKNAVNEMVKKLTGNRQKPTARVEAWDNWVLW